MTAMPLTHAELKNLLRAALHAAESGADDMLDRCLIELATGELMSIDGICAMLREQADMRAPENDEGGILQELADELRKRVDELGECIAGKHDEPVEFKSYDDATRGE